jgi:hypothetical protein
MKTKKNNQNEKRQKKINKIFHKIFMNCLKK